MKKKILVLIGFLSLLLLLGFASMGQAQVVIENPLDVDTFEELIEKIINFIFWVAAAIAPLMILIAAFYLLTAAGDTNRIKKAKDIILWTVIGFAIVLFAKGLISLIEHVLGGGQ